MTCPVLGTPIPWVSGQDQPTITHLINHRTPEEVSREFTRLGVQKRVARKAEQTASPVVRSAVEERIAAREQAVAAGLQRPTERSIVNRLWRESQAASAAQKERNAYALADALWLEQLHAQHAQHAVGGFFPPRLSMNMSTTPRYPSPSARLEAANAAAPSITSLDYLEPQLDAAPRQPATPLKLKLDK